MKRSRLLRKTALRRSKFMAKARVTKQAARSGNPRYLDWIRSLPCSVCDAKPPGHAHHSTGAGMGQKSPDLEAIPLCFKHHREFHEGKGVFEYWTRHYRRMWQEAQVDRCQKAWLATPLAYQ